MKPGSMQDEVKVTRLGAAGVLTLNRPRALHALTRAMCETMTAALIAWREDPAIGCLIIDHAPDTRGFCAGGDVVAVRQAVLDRDRARARAFFHSEYRLNHLLFTWPKPVVAFMDGVTMGGGVGLALPASFRVATENTALAMPEGAIGLFPDVGAGWYLSRLTGQLGKFLALTGARLDGAECLWSGLATHYLASDDLAEAKDLIAREPAAIAELLADLSSRPRQARLAGNADAIGRLFAPATLEGILDALAEDSSDWAAKEWHSVATKCPTTAKVALRQLENCPDSFVEEMAIEYRLAARMIERHDFLDGVRRVLVDKQGTPTWRPAAAEEVTPQALDTLFAPLPEGEEWTPLTPEG